jgi:hypothetical protein
MKLTDFYKKWYIAGLHFECMGCGACCSGPEEGYIWATKQEVKFISDYLKMSERQFRRKYTKKVGLKTTLIEDSESKDCIFLEEKDGQKRCSIYPVRPSQCRNWPFWSQNLKSPDTWNRAGMKCPGINKGRLYTFSEIEEIRNRKCWWDK